MPSNDLITLMRAAMQKHQLHRVEDLAQRLGITRTYASLVLNGRRQPSAKVLASVQRLLHMAPSGDDEAGPEYLALSAKEIESLLARHVSELPSLKNKSKLLYISIIRKLLHALESKLNE